MKKLKLIVEDLHVESFESVEVREAREGTVQGRSGPRSEYSMCDILTCGGENGYCTFWCTQNPLSCGASVENCKTTTVEI